MVHVDSSHEVGIIDNQGSESIGSAFWDELMGGWTNDIDLDEEISPMAERDTFRGLIDENEGDIDEPQNDPRIGPNSSTSNSSKLSMLHFMKTTSS